MKRTVDLEESIIALPGDEYSEVEEKLRKKESVVTWTIFSVALILGVIAYVVPSLFYEEFWSNLWVLLLFAPILTSFYKALVKYQMTAFSYPLLVMAVYFPVANIYNLWHPLWLIFLTIPVYYLVGDIVDRIKRKIKA